MPTSIVMPALEMAQETGKLIAWLKKEGDSVSKGEPLFEIETDKAVMEVESPADGVLAGIKAEVGAEIQVGRTIAWIVKPGETPPSDSDDAQAGSVVESGRRFASVPSVVHSTSAASSTSSAPSREIRISPKGRRLASEKGVDVAQVRGSGPGGEILASDILAAAESKLESKSATAGGQTPSAVPAQTLGTIARLMAERTAQSWTTVPHFFVSRELEATALNEARQSLSPAIEKSDGAKLTHTDVLIALVARVLTKHPRMNASWAGDSIRANADVNISLAIAVNDGVVAPVFPRANRVSLGTIAALRRDLTERARGNKLRPSDLCAGTFTVSNLGMFDVDAFTAIVLPPQVAILAVGRIADRVIAVEGQPAVRPMMTLTLASDHRVVDGARGAEFMRDLADAIMNPRKWLGSAV
jgi:pyruvate dehydrogenase E2 component (dihydrolipoamide acetyltransferase)